MNIGNIYTKETLEGTANKHTPNGFVMLQLIAAKDYVKSTLLFLYGVK